MAPCRVRADNDLTRLQTKAFEIFNCSNALYPGSLRGSCHGLLSACCRRLTPCLCLALLSVPGLFPAVRRFEAEVVRMCCSMVNGDENSCGTLASGGTEAVLLAALAYREWGRAKGITRPEIVCCVSAHAALDKVCPAAATVFGWPWFGCGNACTSGRGATC